MSIDDIEVPGEMLTMAVASVQDGGFDRYRMFLANALLWLSENPILPSIDDAESMGEAWNKNELPQDHFTQAIAVEWQRRMFLRPKKVVPLDLQLMLCDESIADTYTGSRSTYNKAIMEAYELGKREASK